MAANHEDLIRRAEAGVAESLKTLIELRVMVAVGDVERDLIDAMSGPVRPPGPLPDPPGAAAYRPSLPGRLPSFRPDADAKGPADA